MSAQNVKRAGKMSLAMLDDKFSETLATALGADTFRDVLSSLYLLRPCQRLCGIPPRRSALLAAAPRSARRCQLSPPLSAAASVTKNSD